MSGIDNEILAGDLGQLEAALADFSIDDLEHGGNASGAGGDDHGVDDASLLFDGNGGGDTPDVIDTTNQGSSELAATTEPQQHQQQETGSSESSVDSAQYKEIDGSLYLAVDPQNAHVVSRDGQHKIPYAVLEQVREDRSAAQQSYEDSIKQANDYKSQLETTAKKQSLFESQLVEAGIDPDKLPEEILQDPSAIERIKEEYPGPVAQILEALVGKATAPQQEQPQESQNHDQGANPVDEVLAAPELSELSGWMNDTKHPERWEMAKIIDNSLQENPEFSNLSLAERFAQVQERVKASFGDPVAASAQQQKTTSQAIPNSPSFLNASTPSQSKAESYQAIASQGTHELSNTMSQMSDLDVEGLLEMASEAFD